MPTTISKLKKTIAQHIANYRDLSGEELYQAYKTDNQCLTNDQLDYLLCQAFCAMPIRPDYVPIDAQWDLLTLMERAIDLEDISDQFEVMHIVMSNKDKLNFRNNWHASAIYLYELIMQKNFEIARAANKQITQIETQIKEAQVAKAATQNSIESVMPGAVLFRSTSSTSSCDSEDKLEECCDWLRLRFRSLTMG